MMLVTGEFDVEEMLAAASEMASGEFSTSNAPTQSHPDGFGLVWHMPNTTSDFGVFKDEAPIWNYSPQQTIQCTGLNLARTRTLAIHARYALLPHQKGLRFTQPLEADTAQGALYFLHNGFTPQMYRHLGLLESDFDSSEFFGVIQNLMTKGDLETRLCALLEDMNGDTASANFLMLNKQEIWAFNWWPEAYAYPEYAQMHRLDTGSYTVISSEILTSLETNGTWTPLARGKLVRFPISK